MLSKTLKIVLSGMVAGDPHQGGATWAVLQYALGLRELGHEVAIIEPIQPTSLRPCGAQLAESINAQYFHAVVKQFELDSSALVLMGTRETFGSEYGELLHIAKGADLLINISGMLTDEALIRPIPVRVYLDLDPAFVQLWHTQGINMRFANHSHFVTIGQNIGRPECRVPTCGVNWLTTLQPVVLSHWHQSVEPIQPVLTTVANWRGYGSIEFEGTFFGQKAHSIRRLIQLPTSLDVPVQIALDIHPDEEKDLRALQENNWHVVNPQTVASTPNEYRRFIQRSWAELGLAKHGYVEAHCGWFSDRSACYLASGRPVLAQDTGLTGTFMDRPGLFSFRTIEDVVAGVDELKQDYAGNCRGAREIAQEHFRSDLVLTRLLKAVSVQ